MRSRSRGRSLTASRISLRPTCREQARGLPWLRASRESVPRISGGARKEAASAPRRLYWHRTDEGAPALLECSVPRARVLEAARRFHARSPWGDPLGRWIIEERLGLLQDIA